MNGIIQEYEKGYAACKKVSKISKTKYLPYFLFLQTTGLKKSWLPTDLYLL